MLPVGGAPLTAVVISAKSLDLTTGQRGCDAFKMAVFVRLPLVASSVSSPLVNGST